MSIKTIKKILIANRGEIACRVIRTAKERGIATVAVYSDADKFALHVLQADEAIHIGGSASSESYLNIDAIVDAVKTSGADAVHPGFGFLSENSAFAERLASEKIIFIGPGSYAMQAMGDKIESKKLANEANVNTVPGHPDAVPDADTAYSIAEKIGCPVMLKASAGGGGKGMRVANTLDEVRDGFTSAQNEARTAFGDDRVFVEKFIEQPRHIEIQVIADQHGNCLYLGERECSIQRRHQKVLEEAPSSFISPETRKAMGEQAVRLAQAVNYVSAGTVEFIVDAKENFYFLEMNTRLQVEHPVTECITGLDLVGLMIDVAEGQALALKQDDIKLNGWSFEARVYAEDPDRGFLPSIGRITRYAPPETNVLTDSSGVRVDTGIHAGGEISMYYDPMIAKLVSWAPTRMEAINIMQSALDNYEIEGVQHNIPFLSALFAHPALQSGDLTTRFIEDHFADGFNSATYQSDFAEQLPVIAAILESKMRTRMQDINDDQLGDLHVISSAGTQVVSATDRQQFTSSWAPGDALLHTQFNDQPITIGVKKNDTGWQLSHRGTVQHFNAYPTHIAELLQHMPEKIEQDLSRFLLSPMPGLLMKLLVKEGDSVTIGQDLAVIEAMKMENTLKSEVSGTVEKIVAATGDNLAVDAIILEFA
jgi:propionyl-CoA carboxylase alpha chain